MSNRSPNRTRFAPRGHSRVAYDPGQHPAGEPNTPLVLLHDLLADRSAWTPVREALSIACRLIVVETRGHGASPTLTNQWYTVGELAADVVAVLDAEELSEVHVIGHGLGATTAIDIALHSPLNVQSLTLIDPTLPQLASTTADARVKDQVASLRSSDRAAADAAYKQLWDKALDTYYAPRFGPDWRSALTPVQLGTIRRHAPALAALLPALDAYTVEQEVLRSITIPTHLIASSNATSSDAVSRARLLALMGRVSLATLDDPVSGPRLLREHATAIARHIERALDIQGT